MDRYTKGFVLASLVYFFLAAGLGVWMGMAETTEAVKFAHVHFNLLGFMAMMIYGVGYFILPRFNGKTLKWPQLVPLHFITANLGLLGMVFTAAERPSAGFTLFAFLSVLSVLLFGVNLGVTLVEPVEEKGAEAAAPEQAVQIEITPETRVGEILTRWPETLDILVNNGFKPLADPAHREKVKELPVTLGMACERHDLDCDLLTSLLNKAVASLESDKGRGPGQPIPPLQSISAKLKPGAAIGQQHIIGEILRVYPATEQVFKKYYGAACFSCPGQATESVRQSAMMHNVDEKKILAELNAAAGAADG
jgi:hybrid cluster-associated redox disulfide protein